jgi:hypothetical protein
VTVVTEQDFTSGPRCCPRVSVGCHVHGMGRC